MAVLLALALSLALAAAGGCKSRPTDPKASPGKKPAVSSAVEAVTNFYSSKTKHGFATFHSGTQPDERVEFWFDEDGRYRLTWYYSEEKAEEIKKFGPVRLHMISPDGLKVFYARPETELAEIAPVRAEKQQWTFNGPPDWKPDAGVEEDGRTVFTYTPKKLWDIEGASQQFYLHDIRVYARDGQVEKVVMRTASGEKPVEELVDSQFTIDEFELGQALPDDVFKIPYPMTGK